ncbi:MAG TPA: hypothetical protein VKG66_02860, partial [Steroidobacteraceae bacterium]|nr:hypothetical protein [Steroidobacteraceae bacterium]
LTTGLNGALCATGDSFVAGADPWLSQRGVDVVDMELFAIAQACQRYRVPWRCFKFISDQADEHAASDWHDRVADGEALFCDKLEQLCAASGPLQAFIGRDGRPS